MEIASSGHGDSFQNKGEQQEKVQQDQRRVMAGFVLPDDRLPPSLEPVIHETRPIYMS